MLFRVLFIKKWDVIRLCTVLCLSVLVVYLLTFVLPISVFGLHSQFMGLRERMDTSSQQADIQADKAASHHARLGPDAPRQRQSERRDVSDVFKPHPIRLPELKVPPPRHSLTPPATKLSSFYITCPVTGSLGNRMFQYASLLAIAERNGMTPVYPSSSGLQKTFTVTHVRDWPVVNFTMVSEKFFSSHDSHFYKLQQRNTTIARYFQSWKYFHAMRETILREFTFNESIRLDAERILSRYSTGTRRQTRVGIHVRRGDMVNMDAFGYHVAPASYIYKAMHYMRRKYRHVLFIAVSDDPNWCRMMVKSTDYVVAHHASAEVHMAVLSLCDHVIMTVGTYGWWGGYLSGGEVVYYWNPKHLLHSPPRPVEIQHPEDYFLPTWTPLTG